MSVGCKDELQGPFGTYGGYYARTWGFWSWTHIMRVDPVMRCGSQANAPYYLIVPYLAGPPCFFQNP